MNPQLIPIVGMMIPIIIVPTALWFKHARFVRQVEHQERMRAMELGQTLAEDQSWTPMSAAMTLGAGVPLGALFIAFIASPRTGASESIWMAAGMIGVAAVISGSILAAQAFARQGQTSANHYAEKPAFDPEAFESVGHHG